MFSSGSSKMVRPPNRTLSPLICRARLSYSLPRHTPPQTSSSTAHIIPPPSTASPSSGKVHSKAQEKSKDESLQLPVLPRPLGVPNPPTSRPKTWGEKRDELLDEDRHKAKRKALIKEASQGYFHDYNRARSANGGKLWTAPPVLIREDMAQYFPDIQGKALTGETVHTTDLLLGKVTLLAILSTRLSEEHVSSFCQPVLDDWSTSPLFSHIQINHQDNLLKSLLLNFLVSSLKRTVPQNRWGTYMISGGEWSSYDMTSPLGIENKLLGYVYLIDPNAKIRWAGNAMASEEEVDNLRRATAVLMRRLVKEEVN